ncbi:hypothetical protein SAMN06297129_3538 [Pseudooceanicola antarcticus]|uniref:Uncharacterized protein n=1 Tax=Pseudooceanicola antarcticus TaxID=1247613 RepID=A0A285JFM3_9RHOB|nr:hypothetical protein SAMN06297129_3538 [Pseudooceanicola antarcticus]
MGWPDDAPLRNVPRRQRTAEQKARAERRHARDSLWRKAQRVWEGWNPEQHDEESARLEVEIRQFLARREAEKQDRKAA